METFYNQSHSNLSNMKEEEIDELTRDWILTLLFQNESSLSNLCKNGCKVILSGYSDYDQLQNIMNDLINKGLVDGNTGMHDGRAGHPVYRLTPNGEFQMRRNTLLPLRILLNDQDHLDAFKLANREHCDITFLDMLNSPDEESIANKIHEYAPMSFDKFHILVRRVVEYVNSSNLLDFS